MELLESFLKALGGLGELLFQFVHVFGDLLQFLARFFCKLMSFAIGFAES